MHEIANRIISEMFGRLADSDPPDGWSWTPPPGLARPRHRSGADPGGRLGPGFVRKANRPSPPGGPGERACRWIGLQVDGSRRAPDRGATAGQTARGRGRSALVFG